MIPACVAQAARDPTLRGPTLRVYLVLFEYLSFFELRPAKLTSIGHQTGIKNPHISSALSVLVARGYLIRHHALGSLNTYRLEASPKQGVTTGVTPRLV